MSDRVRVQIYENGREQVSLIMVSHENVSRDIKIEYKLLRYYIHERGQSRSNM